MARGAWRESRVTRPVTRHFTGRQDWSNISTWPRAKSRLDYIVTQFLQAIRPAPLQLKLVSLNDVVEKTLALLRPEIENRGVTVKTKLARDLTATPVDAAQLQQVLVNLVKNAAQAMTTGGTLTLQTGERTRACG